MPELWDKIFGEVTNPCFIVRTRELECWVSRKDSLLKIYRSSKYWMWKTELEFTNDCCQLGWQKGKNFQLQWGRIRSRGKINIQRKSAFGNKLFDEWYKYLIFWVTLENSFLKNREKVQWTDSNNLTTFSSHLRLKWKSVRWKIFLISS